MMGFLFAFGCENYFRDVQAYEEKVSTEFSTIGTHHHPKKVKLSAPREV
ncbi:MAG: hypothetical protein J6V12_04695 [Bacteroidaceae bacterium]|nr:hypothetical protein [Bacteroidaceae bacterium]